MGGGDLRPCESVYRYVEQGRRRAHAAFNTLFRTGKYPLFGKQLYINGYAWYRRPDGTARAVDPPPPGDRPCSSSAKRRRGDGERWLPAGPTGRQSLGSAGACGLAWPAAAVLQL
eukprot:scaffold13589_cov64-Phaeocystis_antarctica.AAC.8